MVGPRRRGPRGGGRSTARAGAARLHRSPLHRALGRPAAAVRPPGHRRAVSRGLRRAGRGGHVGAALRAVAPAQRRRWRGPDGARRAHRGSQGALARPPGRGGDRAGGRSTAELRGVAQARPRRVAPHHRRRQPGGGGGAAPRPGGAALARAVGGRVGIRLPRGGGRRGRRSPRAPDRAVAWRRAGADGPPGGAVPRRLARGSVRAAQGGQPGPGPRGAARARGRCALRGVERLGGVERGALAGAPAAGRVDQRHRPPAVGQRPEVKMIDWPSPVG